MKNRNDRPGLIRGVKYSCGCFAGSDRNIPFAAVYRRCILHGKPIIKIFRKRGRND